MARFLTEYVAGVAPAAPGYRTIGIRPYVGGGLTSARASVATPYGAASSSWRRDGETITLDVTVPPGSTARVHVGTGAPKTLTVGTHTLTCPWPGHD
ncbi:alpha-L-rhamnosidase C-terminal domain-containing protein [Streptomyces sp. NPDC002643]